MKAILINKVTGERIPVSSTTEHAASSYAQPVWVDDEGQAYCVVGFANPFYDIEDIEGETTDTLAEICRTLDNARRVRHMTIAQLATRVGVSEPTVAALLKGKGTVSLATMAAVADTLGVRFKME